MGSGRQPFHGQSSKMFRSVSLAILILLAVSTQGARIFRNPEPHLPAENVPSASGYAEIHSSASDPRSAAEEDSYFAPGAWRPVRDPDLSSSGRRRVSSSSGHAGNLQVASARNLRHEDEKPAGSVEARTSPPSANSPSTTLGHSIALVANQLLQGSDIVESRSPEGSTTTSVNAGNWPQAPLDVRTPPKLMLQLSGQNNAEIKEEEPSKNVAPVNDDPMGENFFPSRRHPPGVTQHVATTAGITVTQMTVSTDTAKEGEQKLPSSSSTAISLGNKKDEKRPSTTLLVSSKKPLTTSTTPTPVTTPTTPTSVRWKIAIPPNRPARFPPRKPATLQTAVGSNANGNKDILKKDNKPSNSIPTNFRPSINSGGITRPASFLTSPRQPTPATVRDITTPRPVATTPRVIVKSTSSIPTSIPTTTTTRSINQSSVTTTSVPTITTTSDIKPTTTPPQQTPTSSTTPPNKEVIEVQPKKPSGIEKEIDSMPTVTEVIKTDIASTVENKEETPSTTTARPRRPSNKRKKNKNRRRRPSSKKPANSHQADALSSATELEVKESPQEDNSGSIASPLSTRIYNFIAREVMPSMSVGLLGLVVTAGLAGYFLLPTLGGLQRRSDVTDGLVTGYGSGSSYGSGQDDDGGIMASIFQNVMASVRNGENEFERGPRRRRNVIQADETENEVDATLHEKDNRFGQQTHLTDTTTPVSATYLPPKDLTNDQTAEHPPGASGGELHIDASTEGSVGDDEGTTTTEEAIKNENPSQELTPTYEWEVHYDDNPFSLMGILRRIADFKIRIGVGLLRATTDVIARYLEDVQKRLRDSDRHEWLRDLGSTVRRIRRSIDPPPIDSDEDSIIHYPRKRFSRIRRTRRQS